MSYFTFMTRNAIWGVESDEGIAKALFHLIEKLALDDTDQSLALRTAYQWPEGKQPTKVYNLSEEPPTDTTREVSSND